MISLDKNPSEWALLNFELGDLQSHLGDLIAQLNSAQGCDEEDFRIQIGHLYAHLNRAWRLRDHRGEMTDELFAAYGRFPDDIEPVG